MDNMRKSEPRVRPLNGPRRQRGMIAMIIAIIVLVSTLLAVIGLMRSVDTGNLIAGSLTFRQGVVQEAERAYLAAKASIPFGIATDTDNTAVGYYASLQAADSARKDIPGILTGDDPTGGVEMPAAENGNKVRYMVERLCRTAGTFAEKGNCIVPGAYTTGGTNDEASSLIAPGSALAAYRLTVRVDGPRRALAYVQTIIR